MSGSVQSGHTGKSIHRLSLKIASLATLTAIVSGILVLVLSGTRLGWPSILIVVIVFPTVYFACYRLLFPRMDALRQTLSRIATHESESTNQGIPARITDELDELIENFEATSSTLSLEFNELRELENYRRVFVGNVSHELKTPIFSILGYAETLLGGAIEDDTVNRAFIEKIDRNAQRLSNLARDLGEISRLETGELQMNFEPFSLSSLAGDVIDSVESIASDRHITLSVSIADELPDVIGDAIHLRQVLVNLTENAVKYTNEQGFVEIVARMAGPEKVKLSVADNGIGIAKNHIPRITERFFRVDTSRSRSAGGTGLGLAIVKHILAAHQETLQIESNPGVGSTFGFYLPVFDSYQDVD